jgi:hypothetical protein
MKRIDSFLFSCSSRINSTNWTKIQESCGKGNYMIDRVKSWTETTRPVKCHVEFEESLHSNLDGIAGLPGQRSSVDPFQEIVYHFLNLPLASTHLLMNF